MLHISAALTAYILILTAVLGAVMGSFSACAAGRMAAGESFLRGRSHCDGCGHVLSVRDLIPVLSYLAQKGRCRYCGAKVPARCLWTEILGAAAFAGVVLRFDVTAKAAQVLVITVLLAMIALVDYDTGEIPDSLIAAVFLDFLLFLPLTARGELSAAVGRGLLGGAAAALPLLAVVLVMDRVLGRESMGGGDLKLFFVTGMFFSWQEVLFYLILSCLLGIVFSLVSQRTVGDPDNPKAFPFGPAIALGAYISLLIAQPAVAAYWNLFL